MKKIILLIMTFFVGLIVGATSTRFFYLALISMVWPFILASTIWLLPSTSLSKGERAVLTVSVFLTFLFGLIGGFYVG